MRFIHLLIFTAFVCSISASTASHANEATPEATARQALKQAVEDIDRRYQAAPDLRFSFRRVSVESDTTPEKMRDEGETGKDRTEYIYHPLKPLEQRFELIYPSQTTQKKKYQKTLAELIKTEREASMDKNTFADRDMLIIPGDDDNFKPDDMVYSRETKRDYVFSFSPDGTFFDGPDDVEDNNSMSKKDKKVAKRMAKAMRGEVLIDKLNPRLKQIHIWLANSVKLGKGTKMKRMDIRLDVRPVYKGGPLMIADQHMDMKVKIVLFSIKAKETEIITDVKPVTE